MSADLLARFLREVQEFRGDYSAAREFSARWDESLGFRKAEVEAALGASTPPRAPDDEQGWIGLPLPSLETPYPELLSALEALPTEPADPHLVDLGAAYGRAGLLLHVLRPESAFTGIELRAERAAEANRAFRALGLSSLRITPGNLAETPLPSADAYFIYDLGTVARIRDVLERIRAEARRRPVAVIGRGRATRNLIETEHPWLSQVHPPRHFVNLSVYRSG